LELITRKAFSYINTNNLNFSSFNLYDEHLVDLSNQCYSIDEIKRPSFPKILQELVRCSFRLQNDCELIIPLKEGENILNYSKLNIPFNHDNLNILVIKVIHIDISNSYEFKISKNIDSEPQCLLTDKNSNEIILTKSQFLDLDSSCKISIFGDNHFYQIVYDEKSNTVMLKKKEKKERNKIWGYNKIG